MANGPTLDPSEGGEGRGGHPAGTAGSSSNRRLSQDWANGHEAQLLVSPYFFNVF